MKRNWSLAAVAAAMMIWGNGCIVVGGGGTTRNNYDRCNNSAECPGLLFCRTANTVVSGTPGDFCTESCTPGSICPSSPRGLAATCVTVGGTGQCYENCGPSNSCPTGFTCAMVGGSQFCTPGAGGGTTPPPCGNAGQACCAGNTCSGGGLVCAGTTCVLAPYSGCSAADATANSACGTGVSSSGAPVPTTCRRPMVANAGPTGYCTAKCNGGPSMCPAGAAGQTINCYLLSGAADGDCYVDCPDGTGCPTGTVCTMVMPMGVAGQVRICMPPPS